MKRQDGKEEVRWIIFTVQNGDMEHRSYEINLAKTCMT